MVGNPLQWSLLFARQPEPDLEFTEEELDQTTATRPISPMKPGKEVRRRQADAVDFSASLGRRDRIPRNGTGTTCRLARSIYRGQHTRACSHCQSSKTHAASAFVTGTRRHGADDPAGSIGRDARTNSPNRSSSAAPQGQPSSPSSPQPTLRRPLAPSSLLPCLPRGQKVTAIGNPTIPAETIPPSWIPLAPNRVLLFVLASR